ncbi:MAG TPA: hypothetical protein VN706_12530 [Gemmatimonadaceae bacterium]|nr:hypothetical protein [Gemmatimonadaceae bacterium]
MLAPASTLAPPTNALVLHLASFGIIGGRHDRVPPARLSCHAVIAGWIAISGPRWIAVDTIAACAADGLPLTRGRDAVAIVADSGTLAGGAADQLGFMSTITPQVLPHAAGSIGVLRGDTLWVRAVSDSRLERVYAR